MVKKSIRPRGRPRNFDENEALDRATRVFWTKGYDGATVDDLVAGTGVGRPSLYATFGDKEALFLRCLEHYGKTIGARAMQALFAEPEIRSAVAGFLRQGIENCTDAASPPGCLFACVVPAIYDEKVREISAHAMAQSERMVEQRFQTAVTAGELPPDFPCAARSRQLLDIAMALALRARAGATRETLLADAEEGAALIFGQMIVN